MARVEKRKRPLLRKAGPDWRDKRGGRHGVGASAVSDLPRFLFARWRGGLILAFPLVAAVQSPSARADSGARMEGDAIAFAVQDNGSKAVRADLVFGLKDLAAVWRHGRDGGIETPFAVQVN